MTPSRNVALMSPATTKADAGTHTSVSGAAADGLIGWRVPEFGMREAAGFQPSGRAAGGRPGQPHVLHHLGGFVVNQPSTSVNPCRTAYIGQAVQALIDGS
jgi:hypothetical protein